MDNSAEQPQKEIILSQGNLYQEDTFTDLHVDSIRMLSPIKSDGTADFTPTPLFVDQARIMSPEGPMDPCLFSVLSMQNH